MTSAGIQRPVRLRDMPKWRVAPETMPQWIAAFEAAGVPEPVLDAYATHLDNRAPTPQERRVDATDDLIRLLDALRRMSARVADLPVPAFVGYTLATAHPLLTQDIFARMEEWDFRPLGWLAAAAGLTPTEYDIRRPESRTLVTLAVLRQGPAAGLLAEALA